MDELIRQLTHDNKQLHDQWPIVFEKCHKLSADIPEVDQPTFKVNCLNALADYMLADSEEVAQIKEVFLNSTMGRLVDGPLPSLDELVSIFCRLFDVPDTNRLLNYQLMRRIYDQYKLGERLCNQDCVESTERILLCLQKHAFSNEHMESKMQEHWKDFVSRDIFSSVNCHLNKLNNEQIMLRMRRTFQQLYRHAAYHSHYSAVWTQVLHVIQQTFPTLFDSFTSPHDAQLHFAASLTPPISSDYIFMLAKALERQPDLFKAHEPQVYTALEKLISQNNLKEAECLVRHAIVTHFHLINHLDELLHMLIRVCPSLVDADARTHFCKLVMSPFSYALVKKKPNKKVAVTLFDLLVAILDLRVIEAPECAYRMLDISEFYPWKQLGEQLTHLVRSCIAYDQIIVPSTSSELDKLESIPKLIGERVQANPIILSATHEAALEAVMKWSSPVNADTGQLYQKHVYAMGEHMTELIDNKHFSVQLTTQLLTILQKHLDNREDETYQFDQHFGYFLVRVAKLIKGCIQQLKILPKLVHEQIGSYVLSSLNCPLHSESGTITSEHTAATIIWFVAVPCIDSNENAHVYEAPINRLFQMIYEEDEKSMATWWSTFWMIVVMKAPEMAADHSAQLLQEVLDYQQMNLLMLFPTFYAKRPQPFHDRLDDLIHALTSDNAQHLLSIASLLDTIFKAQPQLITQAQVDLLFAVIDSQRESTHAIGAILRTLSHVANAQPHLFHHHRPQLIRLVTEQSTFDAFTCLQQYLVATTIINGQQAAEECLTLLIDLVRNTTSMSSELSTRVFHTCQLIGIRHKQVLASKRDALVAYESNSTCRMLVDLIDGNKLSEENQAAISRTVEEMAQIEQRVMHTERDVQQMTKVVKQQELNTVVARHPLRQTDPAVIITTTDYLNQIEGRLDALASEIQAVRDDIRLLRHHLLQQQ